jgi:uncharacterized membrane protein YfcA
MTWWQAALWGFAGGGAASGLSLSAAVVSAGYKWPWRRRQGELGPRLFVLAAGLVLGALVAAAAHDQISGPWPAFIFGIGAPATIRGLLSGVEVTPSSQSVGRAARRRSTEPQPQLPAEGEVREDAS